MSLQLIDLKFRQGAFALEANCELKARVTGLFGPSGAGKTTLLELVAGVRKPNSGRIKIDGTAVEHLAPEDRRMGYVPQDLALFPHLTVEGNLRFAFSARENHFRHIVDSLGLEALLRRKPRDISGGEKQRVALGRGLMRSPRLLLLDEPLSSLDPTLKSSLLELLGKTAAEFETPILYVTHDPAELAMICQDVIVLERGRIVRHGRFDLIFERVNEPRYRLIAPS